MVYTLDSYKMKEINLSSSKMKEYKRNDDHWYVLLCTANFTLCLIYEKQAVTICANILKLSWCLQNVNIISLIADEVAENLCLLKCFTKKPKLEQKQEVTCDKDFVIWQMMNMAYQMLQHSIFFICIVYDFICIL